MTTNLLKRWAYCSLIALLLSACGDEVVLADHNSAPPPAATAPVAAAAEAVLTAPVATSAPALLDEDRIEWMAMLLNGKKTGYMKLERDVEPDQVTTRETVFMSLNRGPSTIEIKTVDTSIETRAGGPIAFRSEQDISSMAMTIEGRVDNGEVTATTSAGGSSQHKQFPWPAGALMPEGLRLKTLAHGLRPGTQFSATAFMPSALQAVDATVRIGTTESVDLFGISSELIRVEQTMDLGGSDTTAVSWINQDHEIKKMQFAIMGMTLETIACPQECALSESEPTEFFANSFANAPRALSADERSGQLTYRIANANPEFAFNLPQSAEQSVAALDANTFDVTVSADSGPSEQTFDGQRQDYLRQTRWLQSRAEPIIALAERARGDATDPRETMHNMQNFVREYVDDKNLAVGYASALEVARDRSGDCTEHALLLAALGRAVGIPTRVATGLAYVDNWLGSEQIFVPHAWAQALIDGRWTSFDAALGQFDAGHIALGYGDGDPFSFYSSVNALGNIKIQSVIAQ